jgi:hypothetical protein
VLLQYYAYYSRYFNAFSTFKGSIDAKSINLSRIFIEVKNIFSLLINVKNIFNVDF